MASRCSTALVEPPSAMTTVMAFSKAFLRQDVARADAALDHVRRRRAPARRQSSLLRLAKWRSARSCWASSCRALRSRWPWCWRCTCRRRSRRREWRSSSIGASSWSSILLVGVLADGFERRETMSQLARVVAGDAAGQDGAAIDEHRRPVQPRDGHQRSRACSCRSRRWPRSRPCLRSPPPFRWSRR